jgi:hypothetical protein
MKSSSNDSKTQVDRLAEAQSPYRLELPVDSKFSSRPPQGTWEDGYRLSLLALEQVKDRPEIFEQRSRRMCSAEFKL